MPYYEATSIVAGRLARPVAFMYILYMKKQIYLTIIGLGALLAIIGFASSGLSAIWGILITGVTAALYYFNTKNEQKVQERLEEEQDAFGKDDAAGDSAAPEEPADGDGSTEESTDE